SHADVVSFPVVAQRHIAVRQWLPVQVDRFDAATHASRVVHQNSVCRGPVAIAQFKPGPSRRDTWLETKGAAPQSETQDRFNGDAIEPARRAGVPRPAAAARVRWGAIHVGTNHIRLNFVMPHLLSRRGMVDRVDEIPKIHGAVAATLQCCRQGNPSGSVGVLTAVLADARHVSFDVARLKGPFVERRVEQLDQFVADTDQSFLNRVHCRLRPRRVCRTGNDRPSLWDGVDLALVVLSGSQGSAVVEIRSAVPPAVPGVRFQSNPQLLGSLPAPMGIIGLAALLSQFCKRAQYTDEEPPLPNALALPVNTHLIHAVVPIAGAHEGQSVGTQSIAVL